MYFFVLLNVCSFFPLVLLLDIQEVQEDLPPTCKFKVPNANELHKLELVVSPAKDSMWCGGKFKFVIDVPNDYKYSVHTFLLEY